MEKHGADARSPSPYQPLRTEGAPSGEHPVTWKPLIDEFIGKVLKEIGPDDAAYQNSDVIAEIIVTAFKAAEAHIGRGDIKLLSRSLRELRYAFKIFKQYRRVRKVSIFGSARTKRTEEDYKMTRAFAKKLIAKDYMIITGAGPGIMQAGNEGAGPKKSFGVNIRLPFEQHPNKYIANQPTYIDCRYFFTRKLVFVKEASAAAYFPGGFGTFDEAFEVLTLVQTGKCDPIPIVFIDTPKRRFFRDMDAYIREKLLKYKKISKEDLSLYKVTTSVDEAAREIFHFYSNYHSMRYVRDQLVLRFQRIDSAQLRHLNKEFKSILAGGEFVLGGPMPEEANQPELKDMPRLIFRFNRMNNGRLRELIDYMNE